MGPPPDVNKQDKETISDDDHNTDDQESTQSIDHDTKEKHDSATYDENNTADNYNIAASTTERSVMNTTTVLAADASVAQEGRRAASSNLHLERKIKNIVFPS